jgi:tripartite-type tricarboxylate transporter receptor subunit TctC
MRLFKLCAAALTFTTCASGFAGEQTYPSKPIRLIVGFAPGGGTDVSARAIVQELSEGLRQRVVIENRPGANGVIGTEIAAKSAPDGYTLLMVNSGHTANPGLYPKLPYDSIRDFAPISLVAVLPNLLVIHASLPAKTFPQFIRFARSEPGAITYGSGGQGASSHLGMEMLKRVTKIDLVHVPYKSGGQSAAALLAGEIMASFNTIPSALPYVTSGRLRALAVSSTKRSMSVPDVPTVAEMGYPGFSASGLAGLLAPAGTSSEVIDHVSRETANLLKRPQVIERFKTLGLDPVGSTPQAFTQFIKADTERWTKLIHELKVTLQ